MAGANPFIARLQKVSTVALSRMLFRKIPLAELTRLQPLNWLFTSGKPRRYNLAGTNGLYLSEDEPTVSAEYARPLPGLLLSNEPVVIITANVRLRRVLDLTDLKTLKILQLTTQDLRAPWRGKRQPTQTQLLGEAVANGSTICAIRFPSDAARKAGFDGQNVVIYPDRISAPDSVHILGRGRKTLQSWP